METGFDEASGKRQIAASFHLKIATGFLKVLVALEAVVQVFHDIWKSFDQAIVKLCTGETERAEVNYQIDLPVGPRPQVMQ